MQRATSLLPLTAFVLVAAAGCGDTRGAATADDAALPAADSGPGADGAVAAADGQACPLPALPGDPTVVATDRGALRGVVRGATLAFLGVPFAAPPTGEQRWRPPVEAACWSAIRDAADFPPRCPQQPRQQGATAAEPLQGDEDCLYLNVWRPQPETASAEGALPVMVFIHGGGNVQGSSSNEVSGTKVYDGQRLAERGRVVVVTLQYRLGMLGFLALPALSQESLRGVSGNYGLLDQIAALRWVQRNISAFGGDPGRVMIFGESGGAVDVCMLLASPLAAGLFHRAAMQSGACVARTLAARQAEGEALVAGLGCGATDLACLRALPAGDLVGGTPPTGESGVVSQGMGTNVDGWVLPQAPLVAFAAGVHNRVPVIVGSNADETAIMVRPGTVSPAQVEAAFAKLGAANAAKLLALYPPGDTAASAREALIRATTDAQFICNARTTARALASGQTEPVYRYSFEHVARGAAAFSMFGSFHGLELLYVFQTLEAIATYRLDDDDRAVESLLLGHWTALVRDGAPASAASPAWPRYDVASDPYLRLTATPTAEAGLRSAHCDLWDEIAASPAS